MIREDNDEREEQEERPKRPPRNRKAEGNVSKDAEEDAIHSFSQY